MRGGGSLLLAAVLGVATIGVAASALGLARLPRVSHVWPLDLATPAGWLTDRQLADLTADPMLCRTALAGPRLEASPVADTADTQGCGWSNAVRTRSLGATRLEVPQITCGMAAALAMWMEHTVQPAAHASLGSRVTGIEHMGSFACRNIRGNPVFAAHRSQHASANALDIKGFRLADGRLIRIKTDWGKSSGEAHFLAAVLTGACPYFRVAIGPAYNAAHHDHFHLDRGPWRVCR